MTKNTINSIRESVDSLDVRDPIAEIEVRNKISRAAAEAVARGHLNSLKKLDRASRRLEEKVRNPNDKNLNKTDKLSFEQLSGDQERREYLIKKISSRGPDSLTSRERAFLIAQVTSGQMNHLLENKEFAAKVAAVVGENHPAIVKQEKVEAAKAEIIDTTFSSILFLNSESKTASPDGHEWLYRPNFMWSASVAKDVEAIKKEAIMAKLEMDVEFLAAKIEIDGKDKDTQRSQAELLAFINQELENSQGLFNIFKRHKLNNYAKMLQKEPEDKSRELQQKYDYASEIHESIATMSFLSKASAYVNLISACSAAGCINLDELSAKFVKSLNRTQTIDELKRNEEERKKLYKECRECRKDAQRLEKAERKLRRLEKKKILLEQRKQKLDAQYDNASAKKQQRGLRFKEKVMKKLNKVTAKINQEYEAELQAEHNHHHHEHHPIKNEDVMGKILHECHCSEHERNEKLNMLFAVRNSRQIQRDVKHYMHPPKTTNKLDHLHTDHPKRVITKHRMNVLRGIIEDKANKLLNPHQSAGNENFGSARAHTLYNRFVHSKA